VSSELRLNLPSEAAEFLQLLNRPSVKTWEIDGMPIAVRHIVEAIDEDSPLALDFVHGGYLRQLTDEMPFGKLVWTRQVAVPGAESAVLSRTESGTEPSVTYVLSARERDAVVAATVLVVYPVSCEADCSSVAIEILDSARYGDHASNVEV
jgi:hypothetical protein